MTVMPTLGSEFRVRDQYAKRTPSPSTRKLGETHKKVSQLSVTGAFKFLVREEGR